MTSNNTTNDSGPKIFFDLTIMQNNTDHIVGSFYIYEKDLPEVSAPAIYAYIKEHFAEYNVCKRYKLKEIHNSCWGLPIPHISLDDNRALVVSNIHRV